MTSATEKLRKLLDERGIEYAESQDCFRTRFRFNYCESCGDYLNEIEVMGACITASKSYLTPEQAIAAMLRSDDEYETKIDELLCYLTNGKFSKSRQYSLDFMKACVDEEYEDAYNELSAELGSGACEFVVKDNMNESEGMGDVWIECSACHCQFDYYADDWLMKMSYCPNCGKAVK